jgi:hypothetical protein
MSSASRPPIPAPIKRAVRQQCGFGCVICGLPLVEYDHLVPWNEVQTHVADNLVLLCDRHHREKTVDLLPVEQVRAARAHPRNLQTGASTPYELNYGGLRCEADIGSNLHIWPEMHDGLTTVPLLIDDTPIVMFRLEDSQLLLTVQLFDHNNELLVQILDNELVFSAEQWDVEFAGRSLTVRHAPHNIFVGMIFEPPNRVVIDRGRIWFNGAEVQIRPTQLRVAGGSSCSRGRAERGAIGIAIGNTPPGCIAGFHLGVSQRAPYDLALNDRVLKVKCGYIEPSSMRSSAQRPL